jgi:putative flippase GtrA
MSAETLMRKRLVEIARREWKTLFRFGLVGGSSLLVKIGMYAVLSRIVWTSGPKTLENVMALGVSMVYNYTLHRFWTFRFQKTMNGSAQRYTMVVVAASLLDVGVFFIGHDLLGIYDFLVLAGGAFIVAFFTFAAHRFFTFHHDPYRRGANVVQSTG